MVVAKLTCIVGQMYPMQSATGGKGYTFTQSPKFPSQNTTTPPPKKKAKKTGNKIY